ncbi:caspase family protein [Streptomyces sp. ISL-63]|uniref:caspase family protein n=3 Tax=unclassified Streptomyces TaxID=2593676 RepID=UPI001BE574B7|nr:caspase family protein [Streptomyces sp. ISL-63]MBT2466284.1 caspase family protein [Streptomyces sp. ISL-63]
MSMPSPYESRAVLIGVSTYDQLTDIHNIERNLADLRALLTSPRSWNLPAEHCRVLPNPHSLQEVVAAVTEACEQATDALLVYYSGHGQIDADEDALFLSLPGSRPYTMWTGVDYKYIRQAVEKSRARVRVVILDCCYAGRITALGDQSELVEKAAAEGTFLMAASPPTAAALSYPEEHHTVFTGELLSVLTHGVPNGPKLLDARTAFQHVERNLARRARPKPSKAASKTADDLPLARNAQYVPPEDDRFLPQRAAPRKTPAELAHGAVEFGRRSGGCAMLLLVLALITLVFATWGVATGDLFFVYKASKAEGPVEEPPDAVIAYSVLSALALAWLGHRRWLRPYGLSISQDGIQVRRGTGSKDVALYQWHRILDAGIEWESTGRRGRGAFSLSVRLREETPSQLPWLERRAQRRSGRKNLRIAVIDRLDCTPQEVDQALERFAPKGVWAPTYASQRARYAAPPPHRPSTELRGRTRRVRLGLLAFVLAAIALAPALTILTIVPTDRYGWATVALALWTFLFLSPALIPVLLLKRSGKLIIGAEGITYRTASRVRHWPWAQVDRVGIMPWWPGSRFGGVLFVTAREPRQGPPGTGLRKHLFRLEARLGCALVCDVVSLGISRKQIESTIRQHADEAWDGGPRPEFGVIQDDARAAHYEGSFVGLRTLGTACATITGSLFFSGAVMDPVADHHVASQWLGWVMAYAWVLAVGLPFLLLRKHLTVRIDDQAISLTSGAQQLVIPWEHVSAAGPIPVVTGKKGYDELVVWLVREEVSAYRGFRRLGAHLNGVQLRLSSVRFGSGALSVSAERLDNALRRFGRELYHAPTASPGGSDAEGASHRSAR